MKSFDIIRTAFNTFLFDRVELTPSARVLLLAIAHHRNIVTGESFPSEQRLALCCGMNERTIRDIIPELVRQQILIKKRVKNPGERYYHNSYVFTDIFLAGILPDNSPANLAEIPQGQTPETPPAQTPVDPRQVSMTLPEGKTPEGKKNLVFLKYFPATKGSFGDRYYDELSKLSEEQCKKLKKEPGFNMYPLLNEMVTEIKRREEKNNSPPPEETQEKAPLTKEEAINMIKDWRSSYLGKKHHSPKWVLDLIEQHDLTDLIISDPPPTIQQAECSVEA